MKHRAWLSIPNPHDLAGMPKNTPVLLALSGGADSRALLHLLAQQAQRDGFSLSAAHLHHGIRGEEADRDLDFCRTLAAQYGIVLYEKCVNIPALAAKRGTSLEREAREVRYAFLQDVMWTHEIPLLVTAHHADDQLETVLFRLCRGTDTTGLPGIAPVRDLMKDYKLVRPLLSVTRREILRYCEDEGLEYVTDSTNSDTDYARNRIRADVVPVLEELFAQPQHRVAALAESLREDARYLASIAQKAFREQYQNGSLAVSTLRELPMPILRRVLSLWIANETGSDCERVHRTAVLALIKQERDGFAEVSLPEGWFARREDGRLILSRERRGATEPFCLPFCQGETLTPSRDYCISVQKIDDVTKINNLSTQTCIILYTEFDIMMNSLYWRPMKEGDVVLQGGMHRKVRRLFREAGISPRERTRIPLLCDKDGILWVPGIALRDGINPCADAYLIGVSRIAEPI